MVLIGLLTAAVVGFVWTAAAVQIRFERAAALRSAAAQNDNRAMMLQQFVARTLDAANIAALHISEMQKAGHLGSGTERQPAYIDGPVAQNPAFLGLSVADPQGRIVATTLAGQSDMGSVRSHPAFTAHVAKDTGTLFVSKPAHSRVIGRSTIWLSRRLNRADGGFAGVVAINMDPAQLTAIYDQSVEKASEIAWVVGTDGFIRSRRTRDEVTSGEDVKDSVVFRLPANADHGDFIAPGVIEPAVRLTSVRRVAGYPLLVTYSVRRDEALEAADERAGLFVAGAALLTLITLILAGLLAANLRRRERRSGELALSKNRLEEAQRVGRMGDWSISADGKRLWSRQLFTMYGRDPADGVPDLDEFAAMLDPESLETHRASVAMLQNMGEPKSWELKVRLPDGGRVRHLVCAVPTRDGSGAIVGVHGTTQDVTERRKLEALQAEVAHLSRIEAMNAMAATLAHELNQPLTAASNYLAVGNRLVRDPDKRAEAEHAVGAARAQITMAGEIIRRVRAMVSKEPSRAKREPLAGIVGDALALFAATDGAAKVSIRQDLAADAPLVIGDSVQIQQVLMNLIRNAAQAAAGVGAPVVTVASGRAEDDKVRLCVEDNGPGFAGEAEEAFSPFVSEKSSGLGLGLSISRTIVEAHGGRIWAENRAEGGGRVCFTLPAG
jgi:signal transduction histidine kinase